MRFALAAWVLAGSWGVGQKAVGVRLGFASRSSDTNLCEHMGLRCEPMRTEEIHSGLEYRFGVLRSVEVLVFAYLWVLAERLTRVPFHLGS